MTRRTTYKLSKEGLKEIEEKRIHKGWGRTSKKWTNEAMSSESTLKRFLKGEAISSEHFINLCQAIGVEDWQSIVDWEASDIDSTRVNSNPNFTNSSKEETIKTKYSLTVSGIFTEDDKSQIKGLLRALEKFLSNAYIVFEPSEDNTDE